MFGDGSRKLIFVLNKYYVDYRLKLSRINMDYCLFLGLNNLNTSEKTHNTKTLLSA